MTRPPAPKPNTAAEPQPVQQDLQPAEQGGSALEQAGEKANEILSTQLFSVQDTTVTVGQILIAVLVLVLGVVASKLIAKRVGQRVLPRLRIEPGPANAIQSILYYLLLTFVVVLALQIAAVPLTVFTIFGGAVALGVGFGSQNIANNFISGLILLIEQPVQVGQYIEVGGDQGEVTKIGARATRIAEYTGARHIIPNSKLLENTVTNWHLPEPTIRSVVSVGVAYGTDVEKVREILWEIIRGDDRIIQDAENVVLFTDFADSALVFELHYWHQLESQTKRRDQESGIRFAIDKAFNEAGIVIAFPQRDVHLNTPGRPLEVRMIEAKPSQSEQSGA